jgi:hypothetical protein
MKRDLLQGRYEIWEWNCLGRVTCNFRDYVNTTEKFMT